jgi:hypothetical protein
LISAPDKTNQVGLEFTTAKDELRAYCPNIYTVRGMMMEKISFVQQKF